MQQAITALQATGIESAAVDARILLCHASGMTREELLLHSDKPLPPEVQKKFEEYIERRKKHEPSAYITGVKEFYSREFEVSPAVLIPRPESELFVEYVVRSSQFAVRGENSNPQPLVPNPRILELGVGSGAVLITLLLEFPNATGVGVDISDDALEIAAKNARRFLQGSGVRGQDSGVRGQGSGQNIAFSNHRVLESSRLTLLKSNWLSEVQGKFDLIVCNPPYVAYKDKQGLQPDLAYEPDLALFAEKEGLACYEEIAHNLLSALADNGFALFEIGLGMLDAVKEIFTRKGLKFRGCLDDFSGIPRIAAFSAAT